MPDVRSLLCPIDFSEASCHALEHAKAVATWYGAKVIGHHVYNPVYVPVPGLSLAGYQDNTALEATVLADLREQLEGWLKPAQAAGLQTVAIVDVGRPSHTILARADELKPDLLVIGTHGASGFEHLVLGSVAENVLRQAVCPVMTVPPRARSTSKLPFKRILCPTDFADQSLTALEFAFSLAEEADAELTVMHVLEWPAGTQGLANRACNVPEYGRYQEEDAAARLAAAVPDKVRQWCAPSTRLVHGTPYKEILGAATEDRADLIVMGVQGRNVFDLALFGSTTNQVVRRATCPVLTIRR
jgi:nucleotide-binding universal stress UspA family protein